MAYLAEQGLNMAVSIRSTQDLLIEEVIHDSKRYHVIAFTKAPGGPLTDVTSDFAIIKQWGRGMGRMHKLGKKTPPLRHSCTVWRFPNGMIM